MNEAGASSEDPSPGRCPIGEQDGTCNYRTTAYRRKTRRKCSREENRVAMQYFQYYYRNKCRRNGYRKIMHAM